MPERVLHLQVSSGLASRLRAVVGAIAYCHATDRRLIVDWPRKEPSETLGTFEAGFHDLWSNPEIEETDCKRRFQGLRLDNADIMSDEPAWLELRTCHIEPFLPFMADNRPGPFIDSLRPTESVYSAAEDIMASSRCDHAELSVSVGQLHARWSVVGVNIRHALKQPSVAEPEWFIGRMRTFPETTLFFCSLDSLSVEVLLRQEFGDRIICQRKDYAYDRAGIIKTCADLYLLAACDYVIGSNYSSYSQMVAFMRGAQYVGPHDKPGRGLIGGRYEDLWNPPEGT
jgi:hypothetical protein